MGKGLPWPPRPQSPGHLPEQVLQLPAVPQPSTCLPALGLNVTTHTKPLAGHPVWAQCGQEGVLGEEIRCPSGPHLQEALGSPAGLQVILRVGDALPGALALEAQRGEVPVLVQGPAEHLVHSVGVLLWAAGV